jgi:hypothetical protein
MAFSYGRTRIAADLRGDSAGLQARSFLTGTIILLRC